MKRALVFVVLAACPSTPPRPDGGVEDAGRSDAGPGTRVETLDLETGTPDFHGAVTRLASIGTHAYGVYEGEPHAPFFSDGTPAGTHVIEVRPRSSASYIHDLQPAAGLAFFSMDDGTWGRELWRTDGTVAGTRRLTDCAPGAGHAFPGFSDETRRFALTGGGAYFACPSTPHRLDVVSGALVELSSAPNASEFRDVNGRVYFSADAPDGGRLAFVSDGTAATTRALSELRVGHAPEFTPVFEDVFFAGGENEELLLAASLDGGVRVVKQLASLPNRGAHAFIGALGRLFFVGPHDTLSEALWVSDGTEAGTRPLTDAGLAFDYTQWPGSPGAPWFGRPLLAPLNAHLYFVANGVLWRTDGGSAEPVSGAQSCDAPAGSHLGVANGRLVFPTVSGALCAFDEVGAATTLASGLQTFQGASFAPLFPDRLVVGLFSAALVTNGTSTDTSALSGLRRPQASSYARDFIAAGDAIVFSAGGARIWESSGSRVLLDAELRHLSEAPFGVVASTPDASLLRVELDGGTSLLVSSIGQFGHRVAAVGSRALFGGCGFTPSPVDEVWVTDGTLAGSRLLTRAATFGCQSASIASDGAQAWYVLSDGLRWTDGTSVEPVAIPLAQFEVLLRHTLVAGEGTAWISSTRALWRARRRAANSFEVVRVGDAPPDFENPLVWKGELYFSAGGLHRTDGDAGVVALTPSYAGPTHLTPAGDDLYFGAVELDAGRELWKTRGTPGTTARVADLWPGLGTGFIGPALWLEPERVLVFTGADPAGGMELWRTDGTAAGTRRVVDLVPGPGSSEPLELARAGSWLYFSASDPDAGTELRRTPVSGLAP